MPAQALDITYHKLKLYRKCEVRPSVKLLRTHYLSSFPTFRPLANMTKRAQDRKFFKSCFRTKTIIRTPRVLGETNDCAKKISINEEGWALVQTELLYSVYLCIRYPVGSTNQNYSRWFQFRILMAESYLVFIPNCSFEILQSL